MRHGRTFALAAGAVLAAAPFTAQAQIDPYIGPSVGIFFPSDSALRDAMGDAWFSIGASRVRIDPYSKNKLGFDWNAFSKDNRGSRVFMLAGTLGWTNPLAEPGANFRPYFAVRGGLSYIDYAVNTSPTTRVADKKIGFNANAELGVNIGERLNLAVRYDVFPEYDGLRFSGLSIALKWGVAKF